MSHSCGSCRWFDPTLGGLLAPDFVDPDDCEEEGECTWPAERLPYSLRYGNRERLSVERQDGADCSCYEPKEQATSASA